MNRKIPIYEQLSKKLLSLRNEFRVAAIKGDKDKANILIKEILEIDSRLKKIDSVIGMFYTPIGNYKRSE